MSGHSLSMGLSEARTLSVEERTPLLTFASPADFARFYDEWHTFVWRTARRLGAQDADDIVQEVFLTVHRKHASFEGRGTLRAWIAGIVLHTARRHFRTQSRRREEAVPDVPSDALIDTHTPHASAEQREMLSLLYVLLESMPEERREVFVMSELEKLSAPEIANATSTNLNTVYARVRAARSDFAERLHRHRAKAGFGEGESS